MSYTPSDVTQPPQKPLAHATDERYLHTQPPPIDPAVWRTEIPLIVAERCTSPHLLAVWFAIRWLMAAFPQSRGFGTRIIAQRARVSHKYVTGCVTELIELGLVEVIGEEPMRNLAPRPIYTIPLHRLEAMSNAMAVDVLMNYGVKHLPSPPPPDPDQLPLILNNALEPSKDTQRQEHYQTQEQLNPEAPTSSTQANRAPSTRNATSGDNSPPRSVVTREHPSGDISLPGPGDMRHHTHTAETHTDHLPQRDQTSGDRRDQTLGQINRPTPGDTYHSPSVDMREQAEHLSHTPSVFPQAHISVPFQEQTSGVIYPHQHTTDQKEQTSGDRQEQIPNGSPKREQTCDPNGEQPLVDNKEHTHHACMHGTGQDPEHGKHGRNDQPYKQKEELAQEPTRTTHDSPEYETETHVHMAIHKHHQPPPVPPGQYALPLHPFDLWDNACPHVRPLDYAHIEALAAEHDLVTQGFGMYWVGRAILSATLASDARYLKVIKVVLDRWRNEGTYGSEAPWEQQRREQRKEQYNGVPPSSRDNSQFRQTTPRGPRQSGRVDTSHVRITDEDITRFLRTQSPGTNRSGKS